MFANSLLAVSESNNPLLDPLTRTVLVMALLAFVLLGLGLIAGALLGGRWVRRYGGDDLNEPLPLHKPARPQYATVRKKPEPHSNRSHDTVTDQPVQGETRTDL